MPIYSNRCVFEFKDHSGNPDWTIHAYIIHEKVESDFRLLLFHKNEVVICFDRSAHDCFHMDRGKKKVAYFRNALTLSEKIDTAFSELLCMAQAGIESNSGARLQYTDAVESTLRYLQHALSQRLLETNVKYGIATISGTARIAPAPQRQSMTRCTHILPAHEKQAQK